MKDQDSLPPEERVKHYHPPEPADKPCRVDGCVDNQMGPACHFVRSLTDDAVRFYGLDLRCKTNRELARKVWNNVELPDPEGK